jgi:sugar transferase EpsL
VKRRSQFGKRVSDLALTLPALLLLSPLILLAAVLAASSMGQPIFFRQLRPGLLGQPFTLIKFRTMTDARRITSVPIHRSSSAKKLTHKFRQ